MRRSLDITRACDDDFDVMRMTALQYFIYLSLYKRNIAVYLVQS